MSYLTTKSVQAWLNNTKYKITTVDTELETASKEYLFGEFSQRYDTSSWADSTNTPQLVLSTMAMQVASFTLRRATAQDDGQASYADWLDQRVQSICHGITSGMIDIPGVVTDPDSSLGGGPLFYPDNASTLLADSFPKDANSSTRSFTMGMEF